jgi:hypothetical protein
MGTVLIAQGVDVDVRDDNGRIAENGAASEMEIVDIQRSAAFSPAIRLVR